MALNYIIDDSGHTYQLVFPEDGRYGMLDERSGNWTGLVKMLQDKVKIPTIELK